MQEHTLKQWLQVNQWKIGIDPYFGSKFYAYKTLPQALYCYCNNKPPTVTIHYYQTDDSMKYTSCEIQFSAEDKFGDWVSFKYYGIQPQDLPKKLSRILKNLKRAWRTIRKC